MVDTPGFTIRLADPGPPPRFECTGELDLSARPQLTAALDEYQGSDIVLDFTQVSFLDSSGVGTIIGHHTRLREDGHRLRLVGLQDLPRRSLEILGLLDELT